MLSSVCRPSYGLSSQQRVIYEPFISGHSERRTLFHESSEIVAQKTRAALDAGVSVILCIGETLAEREAAETAAVCQKQLAAVVPLLKESDWRYRHLSCLATLSLKASFQ